ncbi:MAG: DUF448 domain-containing protein [bacterium]
MKPKHIPIRTCVGCYTKKPKQELLRVGIGRGVYLCKDSKPCLERAMKKKKLTNDEQETVRQKITSD